MCREGRSAPRRCIARCSRGCSPPSTRTGLVRRAGDRKQPLRGRPGIQPLFESRVLDDHGLSVVDVRERAGGADRQHREGIDRLVTIRSTRRVEGESTSQAKSRARVNQAVPESSGMRSRRRPARSGTRMSSARCSSGSKWIRHPHPQSMRVPVRQRQRKLLATGSRGVAFGRWKPVRGGLAFMFAFPVRLAVLGVLGRVPAFLVMPFAVMGGVRSRAVCSGNRRRTGRYGVVQRSSPALRFAARTLEPAVELDLRRVAKAHTMPVARSRSSAVTAGLGGAAVRPAWSGALTSGESHVARMIHINSVSGLGVSPGRIGAGCRTIRW